MAPGLQLTGLRLRPGMLTSCLHLSSAGLNSALLAVPLPTPSSAHSSVPDELKMFKPAGGQGCHSLAERWHSPGVSPLWSTRVHTTPAWGPCLLPRVSLIPCRLSIPATGNLQRDRLKWGDTPSASGSNPQPSCGDNLLWDSGQVPFPLSLWTMGGLDPKAPWVPVSTDPL